MRVGPEPASPHGLTSWPLPWAAADSGEGLLKKQLGALGQEVEFEEETPSKGKSIDSRHLYSESPKPEWGKGLEKRRVRVPREGCILFWKGWSPAGKR